MHLHGVELHGETLFFEDLRGMHVVLSPGQADALANAIAAGRGSGANGGKNHDKMKVKFSGCFFVQ